MSKGNRQKAGVKSASSHMAAGLLSGGGLVTFDSLSGGFATMEETEDTISLKKLSKRDSSTREKALRELMDRCTEDNMDTVLSTFSQLSSNFDKIIFDCSPIVRHLAMRLVSKEVNLLKKKAERELFTILPSIIFASCDPYSPCATEANNFLTSMFAQEKLDVILNKMSEKLVKILEEILVTGESTLLIPSKLLNNDEEDSANERKERMSEQSYGVLVKIIRGERREEAEKILSHRLMNVKKNEMSRGLLNAISQCIDPVSMITSSSLFDRLLTPFSSSDQYSLLPVCTDLLLLVLSSTVFTLNENQKKKVVNTLITFLKKCSICEWEMIGVRLLPLFSSICCMVEESSRSSFISNWFSSLQSNGIPTKEAVLYAGDCIKFVLALLECPTLAEKTQALEMIFFLVSQSSSSDPSTLQSLILWTIPRVDDSKLHFFLEEILRRCYEKLPSSRSLLDSLLSLHNGHLLFAWEYLHRNGLNPLPVHLLGDAGDDQLLSVNDSISLLDRMEEMADPSLAYLYCRVHSLLPSTTRQREKVLPYSPLVPSILSIMDEDGMGMMVVVMGPDDRLKCVEEWTKKGETQSILRLYRLMGDEKRELEKRLLSIDPPLELLANLTSSSEFSSQFAREVAIRVIKVYVSQSLNDTKAVYLSPSTRPIVHRLDVPHTLSLITDQVATSSAPLRVSSFRSMATLIFDLVDNGMNLLDETPFFNHLISILSTLNEELTHYSLLSHYWPTSIDTLPYRASNRSNLSALMERMYKLLTLYLALYVHRSCDSSSSLLLLPVILLSSAIKLARSSPLSSLSKPSAEDELISYSDEMIESGGSGVSVDGVISLLSLSSPLSRPLLIHCLRPLTQFIKSGIIPSETDSPFSALPTQGFTLPLEVARQLFYNRKMDQALRLISTYSQSEEAQPLFSIEYDDAHFSLSCSALTGANQYLSEKEKEEGEGEEREELSDTVIDFLRCGIVTALTSVDSDARSDSMWESGKRRLLGAAALQLATRMNEEKAEEWTEFFLPSITPIILKIFGEMDILDGSLARNLYLFIISHPSLKWEESWNGKWDKKSLRYDMELDQAGVPSTIQTLVVRASSVLEGSSEEDGEAIVTASKIIAMSAVSTISFSSDEEEKGVTVILPPFLKNLAAKEGWSRCAVLTGCLSLLSPSGDEKNEKESTVDRSILCDAMAPLISKCLAAIVSLTEEQSDRIPPRFFIEKPVPSSSYLLHWTSYLLRETFSSFPSIVKMWYTGLPRSASTLVNRFISSKLSSILIDSELTQVMEGDLSEKHRNDQATPTIRRYANEILLDYKMEDTTMRLSITLPNGWPLLAPSVSVEGSIVGVEDGRKWMLQLNSQLHRNASVLCALSAWLKHAGAKVEGTEACCICMTVCTQTKQLPKARCRTCSNKFHSSCLYKWFESSNQSTCPLCRTDFTAPS